MFEKLKKKWKVSKNSDLASIFLVFSLAGLSISFVRKPIFLCMGIHPQTPLWIKTVVYVPLIVPLYQIFLLVYGTILGQFAFFWDKEKKLCGLILRFLKRLTQRDRSVK